MEAGAGAGCGAGPGPPSLAAAPPGGPEVAGPAADAVARLVAGRLGWRALAAASGVRQAWAHEFSQDDLWVPLLRAVYPPPPGAAPPAGGARAAFVGAHREYGRFGDLYGRVARCWERLESFLQAERAAGSRGAGAIWNSLRPGLEDSEIGYAEELLGLELPPALRMMLRWHDGQKCRTDALLSPNLDEEVSALLSSGCLGSYSVYGHEVSLHLLATSQLVHLTQIMRERQGLPHHLVVLAASWGLAKTLLLDCRDSGLYFVDQEGTLVPAIWSRGGARRKGRCGGRGGNACGGGLVAWLEAYTRALESGELGLEPEGLRPMEPAEATFRDPGISAFPRAGPRTSRAVTRGVEVIASALVLPELHRPAGIGGGDHEARDLWTISYSIRFRLLSEAEQFAAGERRAIERCQLRTRHWVMRNEALEVTNQVSGEAVVGNYPILVAGGKPFIYQSATSEKTARSFMEGFFNFVEGTIAHPEGPGFNVECARFELSLPEVLF